MFRRLDLLTGILIALCILTTFLVDIPDAAVTQAKWWEGEYWRIVPSTLLHGNGTHLFVNCLSLYFVGTVIAQGLGRPVYLTAVVLGAFGGFAASLITAESANPPDTVHRVGISGAIAGLVGLILAVEWRNARGLAEFFRQRNTILIMIFIALSVGIGIYVERKNPGVKIDHAAHIGGAVACCAAGLFYYGHRRIHGARGLAAALLLGLVPLAYAAYPVRDVGFCIWKARRADPEGAGGWWERAYELDPENPRAAAGTAVYRDDPAPLATMREPRGLTETYPVVGAFLLLAQNRLEGEPEVAAELVERARTIRPAPAAAWADFAAAAGTDHPRLRLRAARLAMELAAGAKAKDPEDVPMLRDRRQRYAAALLNALEPHLVAALTGEADDRLGLALEAASAVAILAPRLGSEHLDERQAAEFETELVRELQRISALERQCSLDGDAERLHALRQYLRKTWKYLAEEKTETARGAGYRYRAAYFWELAVAGTETEEEERPAVAAMMEAALREARSFGAPDTERLAAQWFADRGLPVPVGDLAEVEDGG